MQHGASRCITEHIRTKLGNKKQFGSTQCDSENNIEEINTLNYLKMNLKTYDNSTSDYDFAFQIRQPLLPVGCASLYLVNQNDENVKVYYKLEHTISILAYFSLSIVLL